MLKYNQKGERKILITQDFLNQQQDPLSTLYRLPLWKSSVLSYCWNVLFCYFTAWTGLCMKFTSCLSLRNICYSHVISLLISITIFCFPSCTIWCDWICWKKNILPQLVSFVVTLQERKKRATLLWLDTSEDWPVCYVYCLKTQPKKHLKKPQLRLYSASTNSAETFPLT